MYVHDVDGHGAGGGDEHDAALDLVVGREQALGRQVHQDPRHHPDGEHGQQGPQDLCGEPRVVTAPRGAPTVPGCFPMGLLGGVVVLPARCQPKFMVLVAGREDTQRAKRLIMTLAKSVRRWAASVRMARLCARYPPALTQKGKNQGEIFPCTEDPHPAQKEGRDQRETPTRTPTRTGSPQTQTGRPARSQLAPISQMGTGEATQPLRARPPHPDPKPGTHPRLPPA